MSVTATPEKGEADIPASDLSSQGAAPPVVFIAGPTASGKSVAAMELAGALSRGRLAPAAEIVNADAMQVYAEIPILSAQPTSAERGGVPHHLFGSLSGRERGSAGKWAQAASFALGEIARRGRTAVVVGGTGLYFRALEEGLDPAPAIPPGVKAAAEARLLELGLAGFRDEVLARDPTMARLDPNDRQRHIRAWEVFEATGIRLSTLQNRLAGRGGAARAPRLEPAARIVIEPDRDALYARCEARFDAMLDAGGLEEARELLAMGFAREAPVMKAVGVAELVAHLRGEIDLAAARDLAKRNTRRLVKRQLTWFRNQTSQWPRAATSKAAVSELLRALSGAGSGHRG